MSFRIAKGPLILGLVGLSAWLWRAGVRPRYLRIAPGILQILQYGPRGGQPDVRSYPMIPGTTVFVSKARGKLTVDFFRGPMRDTIPLSGLRKADEYLERMLRGLLSAAPTPPLSDEELVG
jgi:hypothetical protein